MADRDEHLCVIENAVIGEGARLKHFIEIRNARIGDRARISFNTLIYGTPERPVLIGHDFRFNAQSVIHGASAQVSIGNNVSCGSGVIIYSDSGPDTSPYLQQRYPLRAGDVTIEDNVWFGTYVVILPSVRIGHGSVIGSFTQVRCTVPPHVLVVGTPQRVVKTFDDDRSTCELCSVH